MVERLFLCGLTEAQRRNFEKGKVLEIWGQAPNVRLEPIDVRSAAFTIEPQMLTDFLEIAAYVFAADCSVTRGGPALKGFGAAWRRSLRLVIAVRCAGRWSEPSLLASLKETLQFLSEDKWAFEFVDLQDPPALQSYLNLGSRDLESKRDQAIVLFSGGVDSLAGAVHELGENGSNIVLLSRRIPGLTEKRQTQLACELSRDHHGRIRHVSVRAGLTLENDTREHSQRTRSFLLTALAATSAVLENAKRICFYENGIMSINLPISAQVVGARASRSTHPNSLRLMAELVALVCGDRIDIQNPFIWKTKGEVVVALRACLEGQLMRDALSCSRTRDMRVPTPHCGKCAQCIHRRISMLAADAADLDPADAYVVDLLTGARQGDDQVMALDIVRSALEYRRVNENGFLSRYSDEVGAVCQGFPDRRPDDVAKDAIRLFQRFGDEVRRIFVAARTEYGGPLFDGSLPASCLLRNVPEIAGDVSKASVEDPVDQPRMSAAEAKHPTTPQHGIALAIDDKRKRVVVDGLGALAGPTEYAIMVELVKRYVEDRDAGRHPRNYRTLSAEELACIAHLASVEQVRQAIRRMRSKLSRDYADLWQQQLELGAIIENLPGKGYRLKPAVHVVHIREIT